MPRSRTDLELQALPLTKAVEFIRDGWSVHYDRNVDGLDVWIEHPTTKGHYEHCNASDFPQLTAAEREYQRHNRRQQTLHIPLPKSGAVYSYGYDREREVFEVRFTKSGRGTKGKLYRWQSVPIEVVTDFELAKSKGGFLSTEFRGRYEGGEVHEGEPAGTGEWQKTLDAHRGAPSGFSVLEGGAA